MTQSEFDLLHIGDCIISRHLEKFIIINKNEKYGGFEVKSLKSTQIAIAWISSNWEKSKLTPMEKIKLL